MVFHPGELITTVPPPSLNVAESFGTIPGLGAICCFILGVIDMSTQIPSQKHTEGLHCLARVWPCMPSESLRPGVGHRPVNLWVPLPRGGVA